MNIKSLSPVGLGVMASKSLLSASLGAPKSSFQLIQLGVLPTKSFLSVGLEVMASNKNVVGGIWSHGPKKLVVSRAGSHGHQRPCLVGIQLMVPKNIFSAGHMSHKR